MKFGRTYKLTIYSDPANKTVSVTVAYPLTLKFQVANNCQQSGNAARFIIYNLNEASRKAIAHDIFDQAKGYLGIIFSAGYETEPKLTTVFSGDIMWAYSYRQGPDWITEIEAYDGGKAIERAQIKLTATNGYNLPWLIREMVKTMEPYNVGLGAIGTFEVKASRGLAVSGATWMELVRIMEPYGAKCFINKGLVYVLHQNEYIENISPLKTLSSDTGLIGTPRISDTDVKATMIFEPRLDVGQNLILKSDEPSIQAILDNHFGYKIMDISHSGTFSGAVTGDAITTITFYLFTNPTPVPLELAA